MKPIEPPWQAIKEWIPDDSQETDNSPPPAKKVDEPMRHHLFDKFGVDLTAVEGVSIQSVLAFLGEVGTDVTVTEIPSWVWVSLILPHSSDGTLPDLAIDHTTSRVVHR